MLLGNSIACRTALYCGLGGLFIVLLAFHAPPWTYWIWVVVTVSAIMRTLDKDTEDS